MSKPARYFLRVFTVDPEGLDADSQEDTDAPSLDYGASRHEELAQRGKRVALMERVNIRPDGLTPYGWDFDEQIMRDTDFPYFGSGEGP